MNPKPYKDIVFNEERTKVFDKSLNPRYYLFDEEWIKIKGNWHYRMVLFDVINNIVVYDKIYAQSNTKTIKIFLETALRNKPRKTITT